MHAYKDEYTHEGIRARVYVCVRFIRLSRFFFLLLLFILLVRRPLRISKLDQR